jgi:hypothetical protein
MLRLPAVLLILALGAPQTARTVKGRYRHPGQGFSIVVPSEATGFLEGDAANGARHPTPLTLWRKHLRLWRSEQPRMACSGGWNSLGRGAAAGVLEPGNSE